MNDSKRFLVCGEDEEVRINMDLLVLSFGNSLLADSEGEAPLLQWIGPNDITADSGKEMFWRMSTWKLRRAKCMASIDETR